MIGFILLRKDTGHLASIRIDEISAYSENETKVKGSPNPVPCLTVLLRNNVAWHFPYITPADLIGAMRGTTGEQIQVNDSLVTLHDAKAPAEG